MSVDRNWLANVRLANRTQLGLAGMGATVSEQIAADYERRRNAGPTSLPGAPVPVPAAGPAPGPAPVPFVQSNLPRYLAYGAGGVLVLALGFVAWRTFRR